jgi:hypothetical protein
MALKDDVPYHAQTCIRGHVLVQQFRKNLSNVSYEELLIIVEKQLRGEFEELLRQVMDYLTNFPVK